MKTVQINIDWNSVDSIDAAEKLKFDLECEGYKLVNQFGGLFHTVMVMGKIKEGYENEK